MKKNYFLRASVLLLALCTLTAGIFVGTGTMAKYIAAGEGEAKARVAKFSVMIQEKGASTPTEFATTTALDLDSDTTIFDGLFSDTYDTTVISERTNKDKVVAPGTSGGGTDIFKIWNASEVTVNVKVEIISVDGIGGAAGKVPLQVNGASADAAALPLTLYDGNLAPNQTATSGAVDVPLAWEWIFEGADSIYSTGRSGTGTPITDTDAFDTALGIAARESGPVEAGFTVKITATQID